MDSGFEIDFEDSYDDSDKNSGSDLFINYKFIDFKNYPHIYDPFNPHIELIQSTDIMNIIIKNILNNTYNYKELLSLRQTNKSMKYYVDHFMTNINIKFKLKKQYIPRQFNNKCKYDSKRKYRYNRRLMNYNSIEIPWYL